MSRRFLEGQVTGSQKRFPAVISKNPKQVVSDNADTDTEGTRDFDHTVTDTSVEGIFEWAATLIVNGNQQKLDDLPSNESDGVG